MYHLFLSCKVQFCFISLPKRYESAASYFDRALKLEPDNGERLFHSGNAYYFLKQYARAFERYADAERHPETCDPETIPKLYYQMAALFSARSTRSFTHGELPSGRGEAKTALSYLRKCEKADPAGKFSMREDLLSEKVRLYLALEDYASAERAAARLASANPNSYRDQMVYFSMLMAARKLKEAEKTLSDIDIGGLSMQEAVNLTLQKAALYATMEEAHAEDKDTHYSKALDILLAEDRRDGLSPELRDQISAAIAEAYMNLRRYDDAIARLREVLYPEKARVRRTPLEPETELFPDDGALDDMLYQDSAAVQEGIDDGAVIIGEANISYDDEGRELHDYAENTFNALLTVAPESPKEPERKSARAAPPLPVALRDRLNHMLLSCYLAKDSFSEAQTLARELKHSADLYYSYFGRYVEALSERKLSGDSPETAALYAEALAYFRMKAMKNPQDSMAALFRVRLYAEEGAYEKAREISRLLSQEDRDTSLKYIQSCETGTASPTLRKEG